MNRLARTIHISRRCSLIPLLVSIVERHRSIEPMNDTVVDIRTTTNFTITCEDCRTWLSFPPLALLVLALVSMAPVLQDSRDSRVARLSALEPPYSLGPLESTFIPFGCICFTLPFWKSKSVMVEAALARGNRRQLHLSWPNPLQAPHLRLLAGGASLGIGGG